MTITAVEILDAAGVRVAPDALRVNGALGGYRMRVWAFCPRGLEGPTGEGITREIIDFVITKRDLALGVRRGGEVTLNPPRREPLDLADGDDVVVIAAEG